MEDSKQTVPALTSLIKRHHKRIGAYLELSRVTSSEEIKALCERHIDLSNRIIKDLSAWRSAYGEFTKGADFYFNNDSWYQLRLIFSFNPEKTNLNRCEELEWETLEMYKTATPAMPSAAISDLQSQEKTIRQMIMEILKVRERRQTVGSLVTKQLSKSGG
jgi:hypothetical protein